MTADLQRLAIEWHIKLRHGDDATWEAFADWLAEDPAHQRAYDEIERTDLAIDPLLAQVAFREAANDAADPEDSGTREEVLRSAPAVRRWSIAGGALAAGIAAAILITPQLRSSRYDIETSPGERREITLDASTRIILNGATRMTLDHKSPRFAALDRGEALFHVRHDPAQPFRLQVGDAHVEDVGTVFDVVRDNRETRVAVAEGSVRYAAGGSPTPLVAGQALVDRGGIVKLAGVQPATVGGWRDGRLIYSGQSLSQVAADLSRFLGIDIVVSSALADRPFSGAIILDPRASAPGQRQRLSAALDISLETGPRGWTMKPPYRAGR